MNRRRAFLSISALIGTALPLWSFAQGLVPCENDCQFCHAATLLSNINAWLVGILAVVFAIIFVVAGIQLVTSTGNVSAKERAKSMILNAAIGFVIVLAAWLLVDFIMKSLLNDGSDFGVWNTIQCVEQRQAQIAMGQFTEARPTATGYNSSQFTPEEVAYYSGEVYDGSYSDQVCAVATSRGLAEHCNTLRALMHQESGGDPNAISPADAHGLLQLLPGTARDMCNRVSTYSCDGMSDAQMRERLRNDPTFNMTVGVEYFAQGLESTGSVRSTLARYNGGTKALEASVDCPGQQRWECRINPGGYVETQHYVSNITAMTEALNRRSNTAAQ